ncbi:MAG TPA: alpha/beta hydrolase-fold protein, partial [Symbiobacteriaceae bacterium]|nr:alpha/beta hydrolase-fold protein [Symbiobacteriaceae bacterium]
MPKRYLLLGVALLLAVGCTEAKPAGQGGTAPVMESGKVVTISIESKALGSTRKVNVYLPGGYEQSTERYPVVYLFRGHEREWVNPKEDGSRGGRTAATIADELVQSRAIPPLILVMPGLATDDNRIPGLGINFAMPELVTEEPTVGPGRFEDYMMQEVIPAVDAQFRTIADRQHRGADGFSLGGFTALSLALRFPEQFSSVGAFDGTFFYAGGIRPDGSHDSLLDISMLRPAFGDPINQDLFRRVNPADLVDQIPLEQLKRLTFHIHSGPEAQEPQA